MVQAFEAPHSCQAHFQLAHVYIKATIKSIVQEAAGPEENTVFYQFFHRLKYRGDIVRNHGDIVRYYGDIVVI